jgi:AraC-like DNA-binding protein
MELTFCAPSTALSGHVSVYYLHKHQHVHFEDIERADVGYLRFMIKADGYYNMPDGSRQPDTPVMLLGPWNRTANWVMRGTLVSFGCVLLPEFWGGLAPIYADAAVDRALDGEAIFGPDIAALYESISRAPDIAAMAELADAWLIRRIKPIPEDHRLVISAIGQWLGQRPIPSTDKLYATTGKSPRQVMRISNRYFGAPPALLLRKFRALRTASRLIGIKGRIPADLLADYSDQPHMSREVKAFTGRTPRQLQSNTDPVLHATLHPSNFRADAPWM